MKKPTCFILTLQLMFMKGIVTVGGRHFDPLFDIPIELPSQSRMTENYVDQLRSDTRESTSENILQVKKVIWNADNSDNRLKEIRIRKNPDKRASVVKCLKSCKSSYEKCCKIFYKTKQQVAVKNSLEVKAQQSSPSFPFDQGFGLIGTFLGVALAGYSLTGGVSVTSRENEFVFDPENKIFISDRDDKQDLVDQLKEFIQTDGNVPGVPGVPGVQTFLCCVHVGEMAGLECYPGGGQGRRSNQVRCESGLSYNMDLVI